MDGFLPVKWLVTVSELNEKSKMQKELEQHVAELEKEKLLLLEEFGKSQLENVLLKKKLKIQD